MNEKIAVVGLGYVGLPVAVALARKNPDLIGFDISESRISELKRGHDRTHEIDDADLTQVRVHYTSNPEDMRDATFFIVAVPTPIDHQKRPDLSMVRSASEIVGRVMQKGSVVVYESTVYPGVTEDICVPILAETSGLTYGDDFSVGYSPERINPGDKEHSFERIKKVISGDSEATLQRVAAVYESVVEAGVFCAANIRVAEAAKVIENIQRDLNIALMNELSVIFDHLGISTEDVLEAARTKWNFLPFTPGLVGGHCIGVDPYYLTTKAAEVGYDAQVILAGRRINNAMGGFIVQKLFQLFGKTQVNPYQTRVGVLGLTFKENVPDVRNSRVVDIVQELNKYGIKPFIYDPLALDSDIQKEFGISQDTLADFRDLDALIIAVAHQEFPEYILDNLAAILKPNGIIIDVKSKLRSVRHLLPKDVSYWSL